MFLECLCGGRQCTLGGASTKTKDLISSGLQFREKFIGIFLFKFI